MERPADPGAAAVGRATLSPKGVCVITRLAGPRTPQALWSAAARRRFHAASLLAACPLGYCLRAQGQQAPRTPKRAPPARFRVVTQVDDGDCGECTFGFSLRGLHT